MRERKVGIRELKSNLSACLKEIKAGRAIVITDRGKAIGRITPIAESLEEALKKGVQSRLWSWNGRKWTPAAPAARARGKRLISDLLLEDR